MEEKNILKICDHTLLRPDATWAEIRKTCDDAIEYHCASVCIPPSFVKQAAEYVCGQIPICTVIGFPNGYSTTMIKLAEAHIALQEGAAEIDMVINIGKVKEKDYKYVKDEIKSVYDLCQQYEKPPILKIIIETCLLTQEEIIEMCGIVKEAGADFVKTSTGFSAGGAKAEDVALIKEHLKGSNVRIKASGGICSLEDAHKLIDAGADRLGTSKLIKAIMNSVRLIEQPERGKMKFIKCEEIETFYNDSGTKYKKRRIVICIDEISSFAEISIEGKSCVRVKLKRGDSCDLNIGFDDFVRRVFN